MTADVPGKIEWFRYVRHGRVDLYQFVGWQVVAVLDGAHAGKLLMRYAADCEGAPPEPARGARLRSARPALKAPQRPAQRAWRR